jgi:Lipase (class 3)
MDLNCAVKFAQLVNASYAVDPGNVASLAGHVIDAGGMSYTVVTSVFANDLVIAIRGTEGVYEWVQDARFAMVPCPFVAAAGNTEDGFTSMYSSLRTGPDPASPRVVGALATLPFPQPVDAPPPCIHTQVPARAIRRSQQCTITWFRTPFELPVESTWCRSYPCRPCTATWTSCSN